MVVLAFLANVAILSGVSRWLTFGAGLALTCLLPGYLLVRVLFPKGDAFNWVEQVLLAVGVGFCTLMLGVLILHYMPGPLTAPLILAFYDGLILLFAILLARRGEESSAPAGNVPLGYLLPLLGLVLVAAFLRLSNLGYSEFQGDESRAMLMAAGVVRGEDTILFLHKKGPVEILLPAAFYALDGTIEEFTARLPFAIANITGVACVYILARRMFPDLPITAPVAAGLLAVDGYLVPFGRLVQYQSVVFLMVVLAVWCAYVWYRGGSNVLIVLAVSLVAVGALAHYEASLVLPCLAWLFWNRGRREAWPTSRWIRRAVVMGGAFGAVAGLFYIPFVLDPHFATTFDYIFGWRVGGGEGGMLYNNLDDFFFRITFYNSVYYIFFLVLGLLAFAADRLWRFLRPAALAVGVCFALAAGFAAAVFFPQVLVVAGLNLAFLPFVIALVLLIVSPHTAVEGKAALLWFSTTGLIAMFLMRLPKTHVYTMFPAWTILIGVVISRAIAGLDRYTGQSSLVTRVRTIGLAVIGVALLVVFGYYTYIVFVRYEPDFRRGHPETRPAFYPRLYGDATLVDGGGFGFPHRGGWKAIGALYARGELQGSYGANEEILTTSWYLRRAPWCRDAADQYFFSSVVHDLENVPEKLVRYEKHLVGRVWADGRPILEIYGSQPVDPPKDYDLTELEKVFDAAATSDVWLWALSDPIPQHRVDALLGGNVRLLGFDGDRQVTAGEILSLNLYWQTDAPFDRDYNVFAHVEVEGENIWGQSDGPPVCGALPTTQWQPGKVIVDGRAMRIDPDTPPGDYPLWVGLYDLTTGLRVQVSGADANTRGDTVYLGTVRVLAPDAGETNP